MSFTTDLATLIGQVRILIGDDVADKGPLPDGSNFTDAQIEWFLNQEGGSFGAAAALACENLASRYAPLVSITVGPRSEQLQQAAEAWKRQAATLRGQFGGRGQGIVSAGTARVDGWSDDIPSDAVEQTGSELTEDDFRYVRPR